MSVDFSLRALVVDGTLGGARTGMSAGEVEDLLGPPDDVGGSWPNEIWRYGLFEIHFERQHATMIYAGAVDALDPGAGRTLDPWVFTGGPTVSRADVQARLAAAGVAAELGTDGYGHDVLRFPSGCRLGFERGDGADRWCTLVVEPVAAS